LESGASSYREIKDGNRLQLMAVHVAYIQHVASSPMNSVDALAVGLATTYEDIAEGGRLCEKNQDESSEEHTLHSAQSVVAECLVAVLVDTEEAALTGRDFEVQNNSNYGKCMPVMNEPDIISIYHAVLGVIKESWTLPQGSVPPAEPLLEVVRKNISDLLDKVLKNHSLFVISSDRRPILFGVGPLDTKVGDQIVQLEEFRHVWDDVEHTEMGFVVRPISSGQCRFIGLCFLHKVIKTEAHSPEMKIIEIV
jgi:hypothetical protein